MNSSKLFEHNSDLIIRDIVNLVEVYFICYLTISVSLFGLLGNIIIILIIPRNCIQINSMSRMFYIAIAIGDIGTLIFWHIREFLTSGLNILSSGEIYLNIYSDAICKLILCLYIVFLPLSLYGMVAFSIERNFALYFPVEHKYLMTLKKALLLLFLSVGPFWLLMIPLTILVTSKLQSNIPHCGANPTHPFYSLYTVCILLFVIALHPPVTAACDVAIILKIWKRKSELHKISNSNATMTANEMRTILVLLMLSFINVLVFTPNVLTWAGVFMTRRFSEKQEERQLWQSLAEVTTSLTSISHAVNFIVYIVMIPSFRRAICHCCKGFVEGSRIVGVSGVERNFVRN